MALLLYGSGLRLNECLGLRVKDIDFEVGQVVVHDGKGRKSRLSMLPETLHQPLRRHLEGVRRVHRRDLEDGFGRTPLPYALDRKYRKAAGEWLWQYVFPASQRFRQPDGEEIRPHLHPTAVQRAVRQAVQQSGIAKRATCHTFRHSFATHLLPIFNSCESEAHHLQCFASTLRRRGTRERREPARRAHEDAGSA